jgi:hypothetical protein
MEANHNQTNLISLYFHSDKKDGDKNQNPINCPTSSRPVVPNGLHGSGRFLQNPGLKVMLIAHPAIDQGITPRT